jgi:hypothetical protein
MIVDMASDPRIFINRIDNIVRDHSTTAATFCRFSHSSTARDGTAVLKGN